MTKVVQAAGRVIRSETDRGLIVLMDQRFMTAPFAGSMPKDWFDDSVTELVSNEILRDISDFWGATESPSHGEADRSTDPDLSHSSDPEPQ
jgi:DNA excision repair protein ERCC-2